MLVYQRASHESVGFYVCDFPLDDFTKENSPGSISEEDLAHSRCTASEEDGRFADAWLCSAGWFSPWEDHNLGVSMAVGWMATGKSHLYNFIHRWFGWSPILGDHHLRVIDNGKMFTSFFGGSATSPRKRELNLRNHVKQPGAASWPRRSWPNGWRNCPWNSTTEWWDLKKKTSWRCKLSEWGYNLFC